MALPNAEKQARCSNGRLQFKLAGRPETSHRAELKAVALCSLARG